jgi:hypothetical protein
VNAAVHLSAVELDVVWRAESLGALPLVIDVPSPGTTHAERADLERRVWRDLERRELADDHGRPHWRLADLLAVIAHRRAALEFRVFGRDRRNGILATRGRTAVLAELRESVRLRRVPVTGLARTLLSLLPEERPGAGHSVSVDTGAFAHAVRSADPAAALRRTGLDPDAARTLLAMATGAVRIAQFVAEWRDAQGRTTRSPVIAVHDTPAGRYRTIRSATAAGDHLTVTPATSASLVAALGQLVVQAR